MNEDLRDIFLFDVEFLRHVPVGQFPVGGAGKNVPVEDREVFFLSRLIQFPAETVLHLFDERLCPFPVEDFRGGTPGGGGGRREFVDPGVEAEDVLVAAPLEGALFPVLFRLEILERAADIGPETTPLLPGKVFEDFPLEDLEENSCTWSFSSSFARELLARRQR